MQYASLRNLQPVERACLGLIPLQPWVRASVDNPRDHLRSSGRGALRSTHTEMGGGHHHLAVRGNRVFCDVSLVRLL